MLQFSFVLSLYFSIGSEALQSCRKAHQSCFTFLECGFSLLQATTHTHTQLVESIAMEEGFSLCNFIAIFMLWSGMHVLFFFCLFILFIYLFISLLYTYPFAAFLYGVAFNYCSCSVIKEKAEGWLLKNKKTKLQLGCCYKLMHFWNQKHRGCWFCQVMVLFSGVN